MPKRKTEPIVIPCSNGPHTISALSDGLFAVHRPLCRSGFIDIGWTVTHVPTGYSIGRLSSEAKAWAYVAELGHRFEVKAWNFQSPKSKKWREIRCRVRSVAEHYEAV